MRFWTRLSIACGFVCLVLCAAVQHAHAQQQLKPYFLVIVDTSGSMNNCAGDAGDCTCHVNNNCGMAFLTNRCGFPANKIGDAKCALQRIVDSAGDAVFGLMEFQNNKCSGTCAQTPPASMSGCDVNLLEPPQDNNQSLMRRWVDNTCSTCTNGVQFELIANGNTPIAKSLRAANDYLRGLVTTGAALTNWRYPTNAAGADLAPASPIKNDSQLACRPVSVILLTDGADTCESGTGCPGASCPRDVNPGLAAALLYTGAGKMSSADPADKAYRTYAIGFGSCNGGVCGYNPSVLTNVAFKGGTTDFFPASNEANLSLALNQIIADAQPPIEICNQLDDDCDGKIDEGVQKYCNKPKGHNAQDLCIDPGETKCDGKDDNCDGIIDNGVANACGKCGALPLEVCDGVDNDCDSRVDEGATGNQSCGNNKGTCTQGELVCKDGAEICSGGVGPTDEACDCKDNDCDGKIDEQTSGTNLCGAGQRCLGCMCRPYCDMTAEFTARCAGGLTPEFQPNGECICINDTCDAPKCLKSTIKVNGKVACAPNDATTAPCICRVGDCVARCDGVTCGNGQVCDPRSSRCAENNCLGLGCPTGDVCNPIAIKCEKDPCTNAKCDKDQVCRGGKCEASCATTMCNSGDKCQAGQCVMDKCATKSCAVGKVCSPSTGACITDPCSFSSCAKEQVCNASNGKCAPDPCWDVNCPKSQVCAAGECVFGGNANVTANSQLGKKRLLAAGGGGCTCSTPGALSSSWPVSNSLAALACLVALTVLRRRRLGARTSSVLGVLLVAASAGHLSGCKVSPFCLDCANQNALQSAADGSITLLDGRVVPPGNDGGSADVDGSSLMGDAAVDGGKKPPHCIPTGDEQCNGFDDDCDFKVDEENPTDTPKITCLKLGVCAGTKPVCSAGAWECSYPAAYETKETLCDGEDNDCNGMVDETFPTLGASCSAGIGDCTVPGKLQCKTTGTGLICEVKTKKMPGTEVCDGQDNDCDGMIDEPKTKPGSNPSYVHDDVVKISNSLWVYAYEASRPDATKTDSGMVGTRACSRAAVLPWTEITYTDALAACKAAGMQVCSVSDWISVCQGPSTSCGWAYTPASGSCDDYGAAAAAATAASMSPCNQHWENATPADPDADAIAVTGSDPLCYADWSGGKVYDLSGNAKEWTTDPANSPAKNPLRGGGFNNSSVGLRCDFDFAIGAADLHLPNVGFRCCSATAP